MKGLSLIEIIVTTTIAALIGTALVTFLMQSNGIFFNQNSKITQGVSLNTATSQITNSIKTASSIAAAYPQSSPQYTTNSSTLILSLPAIDAQSLVIDNVYDFIVITKDPQKPYILRKLVFPSVGQSSRKSENMVLATNLSSVTFLYYDNNGNTVAPTQAAKVNFTVNLNTKSGLDSQTGSASATVNLRNN